MVAFYVLCVRQIGCHDDYAGDTSGGKKRTYDAAKKRKWRLRCPRKVDIAAAIDFKLLLFRGCFVRRARERQHGVREPVIDITHFCSNEIGAVRCKNACTHCNLLILVFFFHFELEFMMQLSQ